MPHRGALEALPPNPPMQLTPLRVPEIVAFLKRRIGSDVISI
jgi:hypothetical protein